MTLSRSLFIPLVVFGVLVAVQLAPSVGNQDTAQAIVLGPFDFLHGFLDVPQHRHDGKTYDGIYGTAPRECTNTTQC